MLCVEISLLKYNKHGMDWRPRDQVSAGSEEYRAQLIVCAAGIQEETKRIM